MYFDNIKTLEELKKAYRKFVFIYHPDCGGDEEEFKTLNNEYDKLFEILKAKYNSQQTDETRKTKEMSNDFRDILSKLIHLQNIDIEICGNWIWLTGNTYTYKEYLSNTLRFKYSGSKKAWYYSPDLSEKKRGSMSMKAIRKKYGSDKYGSEETELLQSGG